MTPARHLLIPTGVAMFFGGITSVFLGPSMGVTVGGIALFLVGCLT